MYLKIKFYRDCHKGRGINHALVPIQNVFILFGWYGSNWLQTHTVDMWPESWWLVPRWHKVLCKILACGYFEHAETNHIHERISKSVKCLAIWPLTFKVCFCMPFISSHYFRSRSRSPRKVSQSSERRREDDRAVSCSYRVGYAPGNGRKRSR